MKVVDEGHEYILQSYDGEIEITLTFVKRNNPPEKFPGNKDSYPGTLIQEVIRALANRVEYVHNQTPHSFNYSIIYHLKMIMYLLEKRAAERHDRILKGTPEEIFQEEPCNICGHVQCKDHVRKVI